MWKNGNASSFEITSHVGGLCRIKYPAIGSVQLTDASGEAVSYNKESLGMINFTTKKSVRYFMAFIDK